MNELVTIRSGQWGLSGVVHPPASTLRRRIGIVLLHENYNSRFGTHRMFVQVAQALAEAGFFVLRYDNRGMCDSPGMNEQLTFEDRVADAGAATEFFQTNIVSTQFSSGDYAWARRSPSTLLSRWAARRRRA